MGLLTLFAILFFIGLHTYLCLVIIAITGGFSVRKIYAISKKYGEYGLLKKVAKRNVPQRLRCTGRAWLFQLK